MKKVVAIFKNAREWRSLRTPQNEDAGYRRQSPDFKDLPRKFAITNGKRKLDKIG